MVLTPPPRPIGYFYAFPDYVYECCVLLLREALGFTVKKTADLKKKWSNNFSKLNERGLG